MSPYTSPISEPIFPPKPRTPHQIDTVPQEIRCRLGLPVDVVTLTAIHIGSVEDEFDEETLMVADLLYRRASYSVGSLWSYSPKTQRFWCERAAEALKINDAL